MRRHIAILTLFTLSLSMVGIVSSPEAEAAPTFRRVLISFDRLPGRAEQAIVRRQGGAVRYAYQNVPVIAASLPEQAIYVLSRSSHILNIIPDGMVQAIDMELDSSWGVQKIGAGTVHDAGNRGAGVKVAILDTGIDYTHPDLSANYAGGYDFVNDDADPMDDNGHGTHVAGIVAARDNGTGTVGAAPEARLYALKVLNANGSGYWSDIIAALEWAQNNGMHVTNNSYGVSSNPGSFFETAFKNAEAAGVLHIAAAGNAGKCSGSTNTVGYPARYPSVVAVAALNKNNTRPCFSSTGEAVELAAPGVAISSTRLGGGYVAYNGTSMASPHVAGVAALVLAAGITDGNGNGRTNDDARTLLQNTATDLGSAGRDTHYGFGLVHAADAVAALAPPPPASSSSISSSSSSSSHSVSSVSSSSSISSSASSSSISSSASSIPSSSAQSSSAPVTAPIVRIASVSYAMDGGKNDDRDVKVTLLLHDGSGRPVSGASILLTLLRAEGGSWNGSGITNRNGLMTYTLKYASAGCYTTGIRLLLASGRTWDGVVPDEGYCKG